MIEEPVFEKIREELEKNKKLLFRMVIMQVAVNCANN